MIRKVFLVFTYFLLIVPSYSAGSGSGAEDDATILKGTRMATEYKKAVEAIKSAKKLDKKGKKEKAKAKYYSAYTYLIKANKVEPGDPDILNYLGFTSRKLGNYQDAEIYYLLGLDQDPNHVGINEYLGELYIITQRIEMAKERLKVLKNCKCKEYEELKEIIKGTKKSKY